MIVKEFISKVADGTFTKNDIIEYVLEKEDKEDLLWCLFFADIAVEESTGRPQITDETQINRIYNAMGFISERFGVSIHQDANIKTDIAVEESIGRLQITDETQINRIYDIDAILVVQIFKLCQEWQKPILSISEVEFINRFTTANFSGEIYTRGNKTKIQIIVHSVCNYGAMNDDWYCKAVKNLGISKKECSRTHNQKFKDELIDLIKNRRNENKNKRT